jgi:hypothetical protein
VDGQRFDHFARQLIARLDQPQTRRSALGFVAGLLGWAAAAPEAGAAACRGLNRSCRKTRFGRPRCCRGLSCRRDRCRPKQCRSRAVGACGEGRHCCGGFCVDLQTDRENCGRCGRDCGQNPCRGGKCVNPCRAGRRYCHGECVNVLTNPAHCGGCNRRCFPNNLCEGGRCTACRQRGERGENCRSAAQCCYDVAPAPLADPAEFDNAIYCEEWSEGDIDQACPELPAGSYCCTKWGAACSDDCDCCFGLGCLDQYGCGGAVLDGLPCPSSCPPNGRCEKCVSFECVDGFCNITGPSCIRYGQPCTSSGQCCSDVPCSGGFCRFN